MSVNGFSGKERQPPALAIWGIWRMASTSTVLSAAALPSSPSQPCEHGSREVCASAQGAHKMPPITLNYITFHGRWASHSASVFSAKWFGTNMPSLWTGTSTVH